jgi:hypothetical protein
VRPAREREVEKKKRRRGVAPWKFHAQRRVVEAKFHERTLDWRARPWSLLALTRLLGELFSRKILYDNGVAACGLDCSAGQRWRRRPRMGSGPATASGRYSLLVFLSTQVALLVVG